MIELIEDQGLLRRGVVAAKAGDKARARSLLLDAARVDPHSEATWLWLAWVAATPSEAIEHLKRALTLNPFNRRTRSWLVKVRDRARTLSAPRDNAAAHETPSTTTKSWWRCPICDLSFIAKPPRCVRCRAVQTLSDLGAFFENVEVDHSLVRAAVERLESEKAMQDPVLRHRTLGLALLNLHRYRKALIHISAAAALSPQESQLGKTVYELMRRLERGSDLDPPSKLSVRGASRVPA